MRCMSDVNAVRKRAGTILNDGINKYFLSFCVVLWPQFGNLIVTLCVNMTRKIRNANTIFALAEIFLLRNISVNSKCIVAYLRHIRIVTTKHAPEITQ
jgi:hypothetical protein